MVWIRLLGSWAKRPPAGAPRIGPGSLGDRERADRPRIAGRPCGKGGERRHNGEQHPPGGPAPIPRRPENRIARPTSSAAGPRTRLTRPSQPADKAGGPQPRRLRAGERAPVVLPSVARGDDLSVLPIRVLNQGHPVAEGGGFEPPGPRKALRLSRPLQSSALPSLRRGG